VPAETVETEPEIVEAEIVETPHQSHAHAPKKLNQKKNGQQSTQHNEAT
jgi:hypothetical protein